MAMASQCVGLSLFSKHLGCGSSLTIIKNCGLSLPGNNSSCRDAFHGGDWMSTRRRRRENLMVRAGEVVKDKPRKGSKQPMNETLLTPRFYTTDFDEMERLFNKEINKNLNQSEFEALLQEFRTDYNQTHFVRNPEFKEAANKLEEPLRQIFVEFLERSCTAEFSGFLLYKELGRRLKVAS